MKFAEGLMIHGGDPVHYCADTAERRVLLVCWASE